MGSARDHYIYESSIKLSNFCDKQKNTNHRHRQGSEDLKTLAYASDPGHVPIESYKQPPPRKDGYGCECSDGYHHTEGHRRRYQQAIGYRSSAARREHDYGRERTRRQSDNIWQHTAGCVVPLGSRRA